MVSVWLFSNMALIVNSCDFLVPSLIVFFVHVLGSHHFSLYSTKIIASISFLIFVPLFACSNFQFLLLSSISLVFSPPVR